MKDKLYADGNLLKEIVKVEVFKDQGGFYNVEPDFEPYVVDLITNNGRSFIAKRISHGDTVASAMAYMAVGSGSTAPALADTALGNEIARKAWAYGSATNNVFEAVATFGGAADGVTSAALTEAGIFNHASSGQGTMFQRVTFSAVTLAASDLLKVTLQTNVGSNTI